MLLICVTKLEGLSVYFTDVSTCMQVKHPVEALHKLHSAPSRVATHQLCGTHIARSRACSHEAEVRVNPA